MNGLPAVRGLLAAACLSAAGLAVPAHAAFLNCAGIKLAAAKGVPAPTMHEYKFTGSCQLVGFGGIDMSSSETLMVDAAATWNPTTRTLNERLRVEGSLGKHSGKVDTVFKCDNDPLIGAAACVVVTHDNSTKLDEFSGPPLKQNQPILKGRTTMAEAAQLSNPAALQGAAAALKETSKVGKQAPDGASVGAKAGAGASDASSAGAKIGAGAGTSTGGGTVMRVAPAMQPSAGSVATSATTPQRGALPPPSAHAAMSAAGGQRAQAPSAGGSSTVVPVAATGGVARELAAVSCSANAGLRFSCATRAGFDRCEALKRERRVEQCSLIAPR
jgi:hypothetical protein